MERVRITVRVSRQTQRSMEYLKGVLGFISHVELMNFCFSVVSQTVIGIIAGKKLAFYDQATDAVEVLNHPAFDRIAALRNERDGD